MVDVAERASSAVRRCLSDAEDAARKGDSKRVYRLLDLALNLAEPQTVPVVLLTAHVVRRELRERGVETVRKVPLRKSETGARADADVSVADAGPLGYPMPKFPSTPPSMKRAVLLPAHDGGQVFLDSLDSRDAGVVRGHRMAKKEVVSSGRGSGALMWLFLLGLVGAGAWAAPQIMVDASQKAIQEAQTALAQSDGGAALAALADVTADGSEAARIAALRGRAQLLTGDTAAAIRSFTMAAQTDVSGGVVAWEAAQVVDALPGRDDAAADVYLAAFGAGLPPEKWEAVAAAQERVGRTQQAERIRKLKESGME